MYVQHTNILLQDGILSDMFHLYQLGNDFYDNNNDRERVQVKEKGILSFGVTHILRLSRYTLERELVRR